MAIYQTEIRKMKKNPTIFKFQTILQPPLTFILQRHNINFLKNYSCWRNDDERSVYAF